MGILTDTVFCAKQHISQKIPVPFCPLHPAPICLHHKLRRSPSAASTWSFCWYSTLLTICVVIGSDRRPTAPAAPCPRSASVVPSACCPLCQSSPAWSGETTPGTFSSMALFRRTPPPTCDVPWLLCVPLERLAALRRVNGACSFGGFRRTWADKMCRGTFARTVPACRTPWRAFCVIRWPFCSYWIARQLPLANGVWWADISTFLHRMRVVYWVRLIIITYYDE